MERGENVDGAVPGRLPSRFQESDSGRDGAVVDALNRLVADCTEPHPTNRPSSMNEVGSRLGLILRQLARADRDEADA